jgi:hypothetical protein
MSRCASVNGAGRWTLDAAAILSPEQSRRDAELRGYGDDPRPPAHEPPWH